jgi:hypothetical protein
VVPDLFGAAILKMQIVILIIVSFTALLKIKRDFFFIVLLNLYIILYCEPFADFKPLEQQGSSGIEKGLHPIMEKFSSDQTENP